MKIGVAPDALDGTHEFPDASRLVGRHRVASPSFAGRLSVIDEERAEGITALDAAAREAKLSTPRRRREGGEARPVEDRAAESLPGHVEAARALRRARQGALGEFRRVGVSPRSDARDDGLQHAGSGIEAAEASVADRRNGENIASTATPSALESVAVTCGGKSGTGSRGRKSHRSSQWPRPGGGSCCSSDTPVIVPERAPSPSTEKIKQDSHQKIFF